jgi:hypothetical protein
MRYQMAFVACMTIGTGVAIAKDVDNGQLHGATLQKAVAGKTVHLSTPLGNLPIRFRIDGTLYGRAGDLAFYTGSAEDTGRWWVAGEKLCQRWRAWLDSKTYCFTLSQQGKTVHWVRNDGLRGKAVIVR